MQKTIDFWRGYPTCSYSKNQWFSVLPFSGLQAHRQVVLDVGRDEGLLPYLTEEEWRFLSLAGRGVHLFQT